VVSKDSSYDKTMLTLEHLAELVHRHRDALDAEVTEFQLGKNLPHFPRTPAIMGVVNLSADSWYRESVCLNTDQAVRRTRSLMAQGADLIDIGAESTLAHAMVVSPKDQWRQLEPIVETVHADDGVVSLETYDVELAEWALKSGVGLINFTGHAHAERVYELCAEYQAAIIICHVQGNDVRNVRDLQFDGDPIDAMNKWFETEIQRAHSIGVRKILIDPGLGFYYANLKDGAARVRYQMEMFLNTFRLRKLGWPVCHALPHAFEYFGEEVRTAESFFAVLALLGKTDLIRTHEVAKVKAVLDVMKVF
jgi:dihydropteroate synthase